MHISDQTFIYGHHVVNEAFARAPYAIRHLYLVGKGDHDSFITLARQHKVPFDRCDADHVPHGVERGVVHQGVLALVTPSKIVREYKPFIEGLSITQNTALVLLDELTDPQNVGAVIRSAAAFGIAGVLIPEYRQAQVNGTVVKVSAGMAFTIPLVHVGNVNTVLRDLKERGFWVYGLTGHGDTQLHREHFTKPSVFVIGNEGNGLREKTEELCDFRLAINIDPRCESLNAAASAAVVFHTWRTHDRSAAHAE